MRRHRSTGPDAVVGWLRTVLRGRVEVRTPRGPIGVLDGDAREISIDLRALGQRDAGSGRLRDSPLPLWSARGIPGALARAGWSVHLREGDEEVVELGRGVSAATGHIAVHPLAAWRARREERATSESP